MAAIRACCLVVALIGFFLVGAPLQWIVARYAPRAADRIPLAFCRTLLWLLKVRLRVEGTRMTERPALTVANHVSWIDILAMGAVTPFCFLAKSEVGRWPILSAFAEVQGTVFVDRKRRRSIPGANRRMAERLHGGRPVLLFPEGTTIGAPEPARFHSSHFAAARDLLAMTENETIPVQPVAIAYSSQAAAWVGDDALLPHVWRTLRAPPLVCAVRFAAPIAYDVQTDRKQVARRAREAVAALLARPAAEPAGTPSPAPTDLAATRC